MAPASPFAAAGSGCQPVAFGGIIARILRAAFLTVFPILGLALCGLCTTPGAVLAGPRAPRTQEARGDLLVPGGYEALLAAVGIRAPVERTRVVPLIIEMSFSGPEGLRMTRAVLTYAERVRRDPAPTGADAFATLPVGAAFWSARAKGVKPRDLLWEILTRRELASLYYGLLTMDDETLQSIASDPALAAALARHAVLLPAHARGIRVANGTVLPAGGEAFRTLWSGTVREPLSDPAAFVRALLDRDDGHLAHFYKTVAALTPAQARFIAGPAALTAGDRRNRFDRLYAAFGRSLSRPREATRLLSAANGPASVLFSLAVDDDGRLAGPPWVNFWKRAFEPGSWTDLGWEPGQLDEPRTLSPSDVIESLCGGDGCDDRRVETFLFVQRQFPRADVSDASAALAVAWVRARFPALALEIERMRLGDPSAYRELGPAASALDALGEPARAISIVQFQGALAVLGRLRQVGAPAALIRSRIAALAALPLTSRGYAGALARWLVEGVLAPREGESADDAVVRHLAGTEYRGPGELVEWEGLRYRVDLPATEARRLRLARQRFSAHRLDVVARVLTALPGGGGVEMAREIQDQLQVSWSGRARTFSSLRETLSRSPGIAADTLAADALAALVYTLVLEDPENSLVAGPELPRRHVLSAAPLERNTFSPWTVPHEQRPMAGGRRIVGALLGLDAGVPALAVRRLTLGRPRDQSNISPEVVQSLLGTMALTTVWTVRDDAPGPVTRMDVTMSACLCLAAPSRRWELLGQASEAADAGRVSAAPFVRVLEELARRKLPVVLAPGVLRLLMTDLIENATLAHPSDVIGVIEHVRHIPATRFDDYVAAVAARGPLAAVERVPATTSR